MKIQYLTDGFVRLTPDEGKRLYNTITEIIFMLLSNKDEVRF